MKDMTTLLSHNVIISNLSFIIDYSVALEVS